MMTGVDWSECALVEVDMDRVGGRPVLNGTRMPVDDLLANYEYGVSLAEIYEQFGVTPAVMEDLLKYAEDHQPIARPAR